MTRKDYILIAASINDTLKSFKLEEERWATIAIINSLSHQLKRENPKFDRDKFLTACGI